METREAIQCLKWIDFARVVLPEHEEVFIRQESSVTLPSL